MKNYLLILYLCFAFNSVKAIESKIIHNIGNEIITNIDIKKEFKYLMALNNSLRELSKEKILNISNESIIREKIKKIEITKNFKEIKLDEDYYELLLKNIYTRLNLKSINEFDIYLKDYDLKIEDIKTKITIDVLWNELIVKKYNSKIVIDEAKIKKKILKNSKIKSKEYELAEIIFQINSENELIDKKDLIQTDIQQKGFENAANIHSIADSSKFGGDIGWINEQQLSLKINNAIKELNINEISKPIKIPNGFLILKIKNKKQKEIKFDKKKLLEEAILFETNRQYAQFSIIYFNKIKLNSIISE